MFLIPTRPSFFHVFSLSLSFSHHPRSGSPAGVFWCLGPFLSPFINISSSAFFPLFPVFCVHAFWSQFSWDHFSLHSKIESVQLITFQIAESVHLISDILNSSNPHSSYVQSCVLMSHINKQSFFLSISLHHSVSVVMGHCLGLGWVVHVPPVSLRLCDNSYSAMSLWGV